MPRFAPAWAPGFARAKAPSGGTGKATSSQPLPEGGTNHDALEDFFSAIETKWPPLVERIQRRENVNDALDDIFQFVSLQRARVPAMRDAAERMAAATLMATLLQLESTGKLPPKPPGHPDILDHVEFTIDPHHSIHSMPQLVRAMGMVLDRIGLSVLHNETDITFITSDNPVVYFDPRSSEDKLLPYTIDRHGGPVVFLFPIAPRLMLYGDSSLRDGFLRDGLRHGDIEKQELVELMNRQTSRFAYRTVFADRAGFEALVRQYAHESPIVNTTSLRHGTGTLVAHQAVFGKREPKPKWEGSKAGPKKS